MKNVEFMFIIKNKNKLLFIFLSITFLILRLNTISILADQKLDESPKVDIVMINLIAISEETI